MTLNAQPGDANDTLIFGDVTSESSHALTGVSTQTINGALQQKARQFLTLNPVAVDGGSLTFTMAVDPVRRNYFSVKLWAGDDTDQGKGRLYLYVPVNGTDYQVGYRHEGDYAPLNVTAATQPLPGRFFYSTTLLPLTGPAGTRGKTSITLKIQSTGELYGLGSGGPPSGNYQFNMDTASRGIYSAYTHTDPMLNVSGEVQGSAPVTTTRPTTSESSVLGPSGTYTTGLNNWVTNKLAAAINTFTATDVEMLARSYSVSQLSAGFNVTAVVNKVILAIDGFTSDWYTNPGNVSDPDNYGANGGNEVWGGRFGALGWAIHLLKDVPALQNALDLTINYGSVGGNRVRRQAWGDMLQASRDYGRTTRDSRYLTNQTLIADSNIYKANSGMLALGDADAFTEVAAQRYIKEAIGILPWLGSDLATGGSSLKYGTNYYQVTDKGLTREWGYPGTYGEMQYFAAWFYKQTGDTSFRDQAIKILKARAYFRRPAIEVSGNNYYRKMERIGLLAWRGVREADGYFSNEISYGDDAPWSQGMAVAGRTLDPTAVGYAKQMLADNQYFSQLVADSRYYSNLTFDSRFAMEVWDDYNAVKNAPDSGIRLPMTDGQPDFAWVDETSGIAAIKHGNERLWIEPYWQAKTGTGINGIGRFHFSTPTYDQYGTIETNPQFDFSGSYYVRPANVIDMPEGNTYTPPSPPTNAYGNEKLPVGNELTAHDDQPFRGKVPFYALRFGHYVIGMNASDATSYTLKQPVGVASSLDLISNTVKNGDVTLGPDSSVVLYQNDTADASPVPTAPLLLTASGGATQVSLNWSDASGATGYNVKRSLTSHGPYTTIAPNLASTSFTDTDVTRGSTYYYVVTASNANGESYNSGQTTASAGLPAPWSSSTVGSPALVGGATYTGTRSFRVTSGGSIGGATDAFQFAYVPVTGNATIVAHVSMMNTAGGDRGGVMIRESLDANSKFAAILFEDGGNVRLTRRTTTGGSAATSGSISNNWAPGWMKLERVGNTFNAYLSIDGTTWGSPFSSQTFTTNGPVFVGLATSSGTGNQLVATNYDSVSVTPSALTLSGTAGPDQMRLVRSGPITQFWLNGAFNTSFDPASLSSLSVNALGGDDTITLDFSNGNPLVPSTTIDAGANTDTLAIISSSGTDVATFQPTSAMINGVTVAPSNNEQYAFDGAGGFDDVTVNANASVTFAATQRFNSLVVNGSAVVAPNASSGIGIVTRSLSIGPSGILDLNDDDFILDYSGASKLAAVQSLINSARSGGSWGGMSGIMSSTARDNPKHNTTLAALDRADYTGASFDGEPLDADAVLVKYTFYGDADFNGSVNFDDYVRIDLGFAQHLTGWANGDFNGDGVVNFDDYVLIDVAFNSQA